MIRGKYLRERKAMRTKRRVKLLVAITIVLIVYRILCDSFSLFESQATSDTNIDIAFFLVEDNYNYPNKENSKRVNIADLEPGETKEYTISVSNYAYFNDEGEKVGSENEGNLKCADTNIKYTLKVRTTTNLPLKYDFSVGRSKYDLASERIQEDNGIIFHEYTFSEKILEFNQNQKDQYKLSITFPKGEEKNADYQGMIEYIEVSIDAEQVVQN